MALDPDIQAKYVRNGRVMLGSAILLFILILLVILFRAYLHFCFRRRRHLSSFSIPINSSTTSAAAAAAAALSESLDPSILKSLPTFTYSSATRRPLRDCAVCLSDFSDGDKLRLLPNCNHVFHSQCIDTWFGSHSNCPLCRATVEPVKALLSIEPGSGSVSEQGEVEVQVQAGSSSLPAPVGCPRKPLELGIIIEVPEEESGSDRVPGDHGLIKWSDHRVVNLKRIWSV